MPRFQNPVLENSPFLTTSAHHLEDAKQDLINLEQRMTEMMNGRNFSGFFKTPEEINADFYKKSATKPAEFIYYSDTLDGCMNIQQSLLTNDGYMEENY